MSRALVANRPFDPNRHLDRNRLSNSRPAMPDPRLVREAASSTTSEMRCKKNATSSSAICTVMCPARSMNR
jgi:hypothetical protein